MALSTTSLKEGSSGRTPAGEGISTTSGTVLWSLRWSIRVWINLAMSCVIRMMPISLEARALSSAWSASAAVVTAWPLIPASEKPSTAFGCPMTKTFIKSLRQDQEGNDQTVDRNPFGKAHEDQRTAKGFGLLGGRADGSRAGAADCNPCADAGQTDSRNVAFGCCARQSVIPCKISSLSPFQFACSSPRFMPPPSGCLASHLTPFPEILNHTLTCLLSFPAP